MDDGSHLFISPVYQYAVKSAIKNVETGDINFSSLIFLVLHFIICSGWVKNTKIKCRLFSIQYKNVSDAKHQSMATLYLIKL